MYSNGGNTLFGELHKELRKRKGISLRKYCIITNQDPGNISRLERGVIPPPQNIETLKKMAEAFDIEEGSEVWVEFFDKAALSAGKIPKDLIEDELLLEKLPVFLRTISGHKLSEDRMDRLLKLLKEE